jgi:hypothetical protein
MKHAVTTGRHLADSIGRFIILTFWVSCICWLAGPVRCASTRGAGVERAETIAAKTETVKQIIETSNISPEQKKIAFEVLDSIATDTRELGKDVDHNKEIADSNEAAAKKWKWLMWIAGFASVGLVAFGVKKFIL